MKNKNQDSGSNTSVSSGFTDEQLISAMKSIQRMALKLTKSKLEAEDLTQDVLAKILAKRHLFRERSEISHFHSWCCVITYNMFINKQRTLKREKSVIITSLDILIDEDLKNSNSLLSRVSGVERTDMGVIISEVKKAFNNLTPEARGAIVEVIINGNTYDKAAEILNIPVGTVRSRLSRAREKLSEQDLSF